EAIVALIVLTPGHCANEALVVVPNILTPDACGKAPGHILQVGLVYFCGFRIGNRRIAPRVEIGLWHGILVDTNDVHIFHFQHGSETLVWRSSVFERGT